MFSIPAYKKEILLSKYSKETVKQTVGWGLIESRIPQSWIMSEGDGITIAVIDTGHPVHEDINPEEILEWKSEHSLGLVNPPNAIPGKNFIDSEDIYDYNGHQTHCTGIICAQNNKFGMVGVAPKAKCISIKALDKRGYGTAQSIIDALDYAKSIKPDIISMSLGSANPYPPIEEKIKEIYKLNIPIICSAGNSGLNGVSYPAAYKECIAIAAYDSNENIANFSSKGEEIDWACPGVNITSTFLNNGYAKLSGTSMACPFMAGIVALMLSKHRKLEKNGIYNNCKTVEQIREHLLKYTDDKGAVGKDNSWGYGVIDVIKTLESIKSPEPEPEPEPEPQPEPTLKDKVLPWVKKNIAWLVTGGFILIALILTLL